MIGPCAHQIFDDNVERSPQWEFFIIRIQESVKNFTSMFPLEIFDVIIDFIAAEDDESFSSTKACSLVSHCFLSRARSYIFHSVTLNDPPSVEPHPSPHTLLIFKRLISKTPEITNYIRTLDYCVMKADAVVEGFATILASLTNLKSLTIRSYEFQLWKDLPFKNTLFVLMRLPTLTHLRLLYIEDFPFSNLTFCTGLELLEMHGCETALVGDYMEACQEPPPCLKTFVGAHNCANLLRRLCTAQRIDRKPLIDISGLKMLSLMVLQDPLDELRNVFECCTQLVNIHLKNTGDPISRGLSLASLFHPSIQYLRRVHLEFFTVPPPFEDPIVSLVPQLETLQGINNIEIFRITVFVLEGAACCCGDEWGALNNIFTQRSGWKKLKAISIHIKLDGRGSHDDLMQALWKVPETQFQGLRNEDIDFDFDVSLSKKIF